MLSMLPDRGAISTLCRKASQSPACALARGTLDEDQIPAFDRFIPTVEIGNVERTLVRRHNQEADRFGIFIKMRHNVWQHSELIGKHRELAFSHFGNGDIAKIDQLAPRAV